MPFHRSTPFPSRGASLLLAVVVALMLLASANASHAQTNYPVESTIVITDEDGRVVSGSTEVRVGQLLTVTANGWLANSDVTMSFKCGTAEPFAFGSFEANAAGVLRKDFVVPDVGDGHCALRLTGAGSDENPRSMEASILVKERSSAGVAGAALDGSEAGRGVGPLARTGTDVWLLVNVGFSLLAVGAAIFLAVRRRTVAHAR